MNILHITPSYKPAYIYGGTTVSISRLCEAQAEFLNNLNQKNNNSESKVTVYTTTANGKEELNIHNNKPILVDGVEVWYFKRQTKDHTHFSIGLLKKLFQTAQNFDAIHVHSWWNTVALFSVLICILKGVKVIVAPRGMLGEYTLKSQKKSPKSIFHKFIGKKLLKKAYLHLTAQIEREEVNYIRDSHVFVLPNLLSIPTNQLKIENQKKETMTIFKLVFMSRIHHKKGLEILIEAISQFENNHSKINLQLDLIGKSESIEYENSLRKLISQKYLENKVNWIGWLEGNQKFEHLEKSDLFVLPSFNENFANVIIECLSTGTPVLLSDKVGLADYVKEKDLGWVCKTNNVESLLQTLQMAIEDKIKREKIRKTAPPIIQNDFSSQKLAQKYIEVYQKIKDTSQTK
ncbi:glycosyltransferase [Bernardetia litoralis DSM 6794]|uniref:Glycosyltransferase n=1 Tax=Bernardetia litoralis (strain ATCC 23117 / DSM 6794 / NBRC 15988 / NCIMB 1366 / Fx l1 / Sio-4) TaxID=880071 RepID=I4AMU4_BERLS|nr:glycosyltransferase [Bernardetia litoralis]AFM05279.1 glycosyltransferase [Bernardetia litoralis DSM 6794]